MRRALLLFLVLSCTVLEDRTACPCRLQIDLTGIAFSGEVGLALSLDGGSWREFRSCTLPDTKSVTLPVPRGEVSLLAVCPSPPTFLSGDPGFEIPSGEDCPRLLTGALTIDTRREDAVCRPEVHKNYCVLTLRLPTEGEEPFPFQISLLGTVSGFHPTGEPREGPFFFTLPPFDAEGKTRAGIPRQKDASLRMDILFSDQVQRSFALGEVLSRQGYDWAAADLEDIELELDFARTALTLRTRLWEEIFVYEKVL